jgi:hypothetical protein
MRKTIGRENSNIYNKLNGNDQNFEFEVNDEIFGSTQYDECYIDKHLVWRREKGPKIRGNLTKPQAHEVDGDLEIQPLQGDPVDIRKSNGLLKNAQGAARHPDK